MPAQFSPISIINDFVFITSGMLANHALVPCLFKIAWFCVFEDLNTTLDTVGYYSQAANEDVDSHSL